MSLQPTQSILNGRYRILRQIGEGGFARVWLAEDTTRRLEVAIKEPRPGLTGSQATELADRFARELRYSGALFQAEAPSTVRVITVEDWEAAPLLVMEYCGGGSLRDHLLRDGLLPVDEAVRLGLDLLASLHVIHEKLGWVHRDLKPANVLFTADGRTRLADFGLAQTGDSGRSSGGQPHPGSVGYMSPEQETTVGYLTPASDLYSLGCVLFEALTGKLYRRVRPGTRAGSLRAGVPAWLDDVLVRALDADPWSRYESAEEMAAALEEGRQRIEADKRIAAEQARMQQEAEARMKASTEAAERARREAEARTEREAAERARQAAAARAKVEAEAKAEERARPTAVAPPWTRSEVVAPLSSNIARMKARSVAPPWTRSEVVAPPPAHKWPVGWIVLALGLAVVIIWAVTRPGATPVTPAPTQAPAVSPPTETAEPTFVPAPTLAPEPTRAPEPTVTQTLGIGSTVVSDQDGMPQVYVPAGEFLMGSADSDTEASDDEKPQHKVTLDAYWIDRTEVTNAMFTRFTAASGYKMDAETAGKGYVFNLTSKSWEATAGADWQHPRGPGSDLAGLDQHPVVLVSWNDAAAYCAWAGRRLPTEAEWEKAARGTDGRKFPWGNHAVAGDLLNFADRNLDVDWADKNVDDGYQFTAPAGSYPKGASLYGALDMAGNVGEWVADWCDEKYYASSPAQNPMGPDSGQIRVLRGGSWNDVQRNVRAANRGGLYPVLGDGSLGFRCARSS